ncbi:uncharacterized protein TNCV_3995501 [Trichonephila clavipes]|nr:uncharacterized protein TNCV_3995501 [Trichonephila clavipes]
MTTKLLWPKIKGESKLKQEAMRPILAYASPPPGQPIGVTVHCTQHPIREQSLSSQPSQKTLKILHPDEAPKPRLPDSIDHPVAVMPPSRMQNTTLVMPLIEVLS